MAHVMPLWVSERTAAKMLDMSRAEFTHHVDNGHLPPPGLQRQGIVRWKVADLERIADGTAALPAEAQDIEL